MIRNLLIAALLLFSIPVSAQQISADRPGVGSDAEVVPVYTLQPEMGTDTKEIRFGVFKDTELDKDDTSWGLKHSVIQTDKIKTALKLSYDKDLGVVAELPTQIALNKLFYLGTDVIISKHQKTYVGEFNITLTDRLTITQSFYYDTKPRYGIFVAWIPPKHDNVQFDIGYDQGKLIFGISTAINFHRR